MLRTRQKKKKLNSGTHRGEQLPITGCVKAFKKDYYKWGKFNLECQIPHLTVLAEHYKDKYYRNKNWTDCLKAHSLYNSVTARQPNEESPKLEAFKLQQDYWGENCLLDFEAQSELTENLLAELNFIREECKKEMSAVEEIVMKYDQNDDVNQTVDKEFYYRMMEISNRCSERMVKFAGNVIDRSVQVLSTAPPCDFQAIAIGSLAKGEANPYSDFEYFFLVEKLSHEITRYFETLAVTSYFIIGNLCETKLSYMAIDELQGWFDDCAKNGFKIDGLTSGAGNIPTGNGSEKQSNHFIVTPEVLARRYANTLNNPDETALRGDLTAMLTYTTSVFSYPRCSKPHLLDRLRVMLAKLKPNDARIAMNMEMIKRDVTKFSYYPTDELRANGFVVSVKKELYRFPSILLLDLSILLESVSLTSWTTLDSLVKQHKLSSSLSTLLRFCLAAAVYTRLSVYLFHDSHDERVSVSPNLSSSRHFKNAGGRARNCFMPIGIFSLLCVRTTVLRAFFTRFQWKPSHLQTLSLNDSGTFGDLMKAHIQFCSGRPFQALDSLKKIYGVKLLDNPMNAVKESDPLTHILAFQILPDTLFLCNEYKPALDLYHGMLSMPPKYVLSKPSVSRIANCFTNLGDYDGAIMILKEAKSLTQDSYFNLGLAYCHKRAFEKAEMALIQGLQMDLNTTEDQMSPDYYGNRLQSSERENVDVINLATMTPMERLVILPSLDLGIMSFVGELGIVYEEQREYQLAEAYYLKEVELINELYGEQSITGHLASVLNNLGNVYGKMGQNDKALEFLHRSLTVYEALSNSLMIASTSNNIGLQYMEISEHHKAEAALKRSILIYKALSKTSHSVDILSFVNSLNSLGVNYANMRLSCKSNKVYATIIAITQRYNWVSNLRLKNIFANTLDNLATNLLRLSLIKRAKLCAYAATAVHRSLPDGSGFDKDKAIIINNLGWIQAANNDHFNAMVTLEDALRLLLKIDPHDPRIRRICVYRQMFKAGMKFAHQIRRRILLANIFRVLLRQRSSAH